MSYKPEKSKQTHCSARQISGKKFLARYSIVQIIRRDLGLKYLVWLACRLLLVVFLHLYFTK